MKLKFNLLSIGLIISLASLPLSAKIEYKLSVASSTIGFCYGFARASDINKPYYKFHLSAKDATMAVILTALTGILVVKKEPYPYGGIAGSLVGFLAGLIANQTLKT